MACGLRHQEHLCMECAHELIYDRDVHDPADPCYDCLFAKDNGVKVKCNWEAKRNDD